MKVNPWLKVTTYGKYDVLGAGPVMNADESPANGELRRSEQINRELAQILAAADVRSTACILTKYDVDYIYISDQLPERWYGPRQSDRYYEQLGLFQAMESSSLFDLNKEFFGERGEHLKIFSIDKDNLTLCEDRS